VKDDRVILVETGEEELDEKLWEGIPKGVIGWLVKK
jgi:archaellum biogenesis ATPase FlaH